MATLNPQWLAYNNVMNEGGEGFNPHPKFIASPVARSQGPARMIQGKARTYADAVKFARNCLSGPDRVSFEAAIATAFPEFAQ